MSPAPPPTRIDVTALLAALGHELRTPLNAILGYCELLSEELGDAGLARLQDDVRLVHQCGEHLAALLEALVDLARIERGQAPITRAPVDIERVVREALAPLQPPRRVLGPPLEVLCEGALAPVAVDPRRLGRALLAGVRALMDRAGALRVTASIARCPEGVAITARACFPSAPEGASSAHRMPEGDGGVLIARALCAGMGVAFDLLLEPRGDEACLVFTIPDDDGGAPAPPAAP